MSDVAIYRPLHGVNMYKTNGDGEQSGFSDFVRLAEYHALERKYREAIDGRKNDRIALGGVVVALDQARDLVINAIQTIRDVKGEYAYQPPEQKAESTASDTSEVADKQELDRKLRVNAVLFGAQRKDAAELLACREENRRLQHENKAAWEAVTKFCGMVQVSAISAYVLERCAALAAMQPAQEERKPI